MQRRRKPKNEPRNIFDKGSGSKSPRSSKSNSRDSTPRQRSQPRTSVTPPKPVSKSPPKSTEPVKTIEAPILEEKKEDSEEEIQTLVEEQLLGTSSRKTRGLQPISDKEDEDAEKPEEARASSRAMEIINATKVRAAETMKKEKISSVQRKSKAAAPVVTRKRRPRIKPSFQPANREKRLDRSRHMEYKYEMRGLLAEIDVGEEFRSSLLGTIWAKGERKNSNEACEFIQEKMKEGILNEEQAEKLTGIVNNYTIRR
ncbi:MAG TPA: hypothetical protein QF508_05360 [Candidatus Thalassarchaeaceae archaeon]|nr:hypothetical protein [Candidatus Thalassarchaeaceae archaeon]HJO42816.1 hypothetical protein [Candidatus Thalassarchaeaceae archaeon]